MRLELTPAQREDIRTAFDQFDTDGRGVIDASAIKVIFRALQFEPTSEQIQQMIQKVDKTGAGTVDFKEFLELLITKTSERDTREEAARAFAHFDPQKKGHISFEDLQRVTQELGESMTDEEIMELLTAADLDKDGKVSQDEFWRVMNSIR